MMGIFKGWCEMIGMNWIPGFPTKEGALCFPCEISGGTS